MKNNLIDLLIKGFPQSPKKRQQIKQALKKMEKDLDKRAEVGYES